MFLFPLFFVKVKAWSLTLLVLFHEGIETSDIFFDAISFAAFHIAPLRRAENIGELSRSFLGFGPEGGQSPVEHKGNLYVYTSIRPSQREFQESQRLAHA